MGSCITLKHMNLILCVWNLINKKQVVVFKLLLCWIWIKTIVRVELYLYCFMVQFYLKVLVRDFRLVSVLLLKAKLLLNLTHPSHTCRYIHNNCTGKEIWRFRVSLGMLAAWCE